MFAGVYIGLGLSVTLLKLPIIVNFHLPHLFRHLLRVSRRVLSYRRIILLVVGFSDLLNNFKRVRLGWLISPT